MGDKKKRFKNMENPINEENFSILDADIDTLDLSPTKESVNYNNKKVLDLLKKGKQIANIRLFDINAIKIIKKKEESAIKIQSVLRGRNTRKNIEEKEKEMVISERKTKAALEERIALKTKAALKTKVDLAETEKLEDLLGLWVHVAHTADADHEHELGLWLAEVVACCLC